MIGKLDDTYFNENNLVNLGNSILKAYGLPAFHPSIKAIDDAIKGHKKIALFLFDGMGEYIQSIHPKATKFIRSGKFCDIFSTNPPTTVAATNAIRSARYPLETGWIGWVQRAEETGLIFRTFKNDNVLTEESLGEEPLMKQLAFYKPIARLLREKGIKAQELLGTVSQDALADTECDYLRAKTLRQQFKSVDKFFSDGGEFIYAYWPKPDYYIHTMGVKSLFVDFYLRLINRGIKRFVSKNPDVLTIVIADHGLIDIEPDDLSKDKELFDCLEDNAAILIEGRTPSFLIKKGKEKDFEKAFKNHFKDDAVLFSKQEAIDSGLFGKTDATKFSSFFGDYVAVLNKTNKICYIPKSGKFTFKAHHAGGTIEEREISLSLFNK